MELSVMRQYQYQDSTSIQNKINHIKEFMECCDNNSEDIDCKNFESLDFWNQAEYDELINQVLQLMRHTGDHCKQHWENNAVPTRSIREPPRPPERVSQ